MGFMTILLTSFAMLAATALFSVTALMRIGSASQQAQVKAKKQPLV
jgi:hypothetical protein